MINAISSGSDDIIICESLLQVDKCREYIETHISNVFEEINEILQTKKASYSIIYYQNKMLEKNYQKGLIADHEYLIVHDLLHKHMADLYFGQDYGKIPTFY